MDSTTVTPEDALQATSEEDAPHLESLRLSGLLDTPPEQVFDRFTALASKIIGAPVALISLVDEDRQFFKSQIGLPDPWAIERETPLSHSFCQHVVATQDALIVEDAREHDLVRTNKAIRDLGVIAYAGIPLSAPGGQTIGSFCAIDTRPRKWTDTEIEILTSLAQAVSTEIHLRMVTEQLQENYTNLRQAETQRDEMVHMLVHDLRTPLSSLFGGLQALEVLIENPDAEQRRMLDISLRGAKALTEMVNTILDISRGDAENFDLNRTGVVPEILISKATEQINQLCQQKHLALEVNVSPTLPRVSADFDLMVRVFVNLIGNAIEHTPRGGKITVSARHADNGKSLIFSVADTGVGIPSSQFDRIFEKFGQVATKRTAVSSGLGLTFCKMVAEQHDGKIWLESEVGMGTTFFVSLPCAYV